MAEVIQSELSSGTMLCGGKYVIEKKIGAGGFGITYLARHTTLDRKYAIKEFFMSGYNVRNNATNHVSLQGIEAKDFDKVRQNFINEARTLAQLNNEAIVKVIDIFDENGTSYMVMPFVEGTTLQSMVEKDGPMEYAMAVNYMVQICEALTYIHSKNILHRDVTPDNVIVTPEQKIVLIDFGSARKFVDNKTQRQTTIVKPGFAPLEQHSARSRKGAFTDIYSVGAVFYYLLTGERPMDATERVLEKMKEPIELNPNIPSQINAIIMKAMEMEGEKRYQSAKELIEDIFSDDPVCVEETLNEVVEEKVEILETNNQPEEDAHEEMIPEAQQKNIVNVEPKFHRNTEEAKSAIETKDIKKGTHLKVVAIVLALMSVVAIVSVIISRLPDKQVTDSKIPPTVDSVVSIVKEPTFDTLFQQMLLENSESIIQRLLTDNSKDPIALYAVAKKANDGVANDLMKTFWNQILVPEGDVDRHLTASRETFSRLKFAFVCGARAYENIPDSDYQIKVKQDLCVSLTTFLDELRQIDTTILIYEKIE